jgi:hypothetical protein
LCKRKRKRPKSLDFEEKFSEIGIFESWVPIATKMGALKY